MASKHSSMSSIEHTNSVPSGVGATLGQSPGPPQDELSKTIRVALQLEARKLPNLDHRGLSDPFVILYRKSDNSTSKTENWHEIGRTETVYNNLNPKWSRTFNIEYRFGTTTTLRFSVYDRDSVDEDLSKHDYIGEVRCTVAQVVLADNQRLIAQINNKNARPGTRTGTLVIRAEEQQGDLGDNVTLQFAATGLRHGRKPFYVLSNKNRNDDDFSPVFYSEVHRAYAGANHVTTFKPITQSLARLTNGDMSRELEVRFMDYDRLGKHYRGGSVRFTLRAAKAAIATSSPARFSLKKKKSNGNVVEAGELIVNKCEISVPFSFIDYIRSGVEINTIIAIDMSDTNGNPADPCSLHHIRGENEYMIALREVGNVLAAYDASQRFPAFGFGAMQPPLFNEMGNCFPLLGPDDQPVRDDISGVIEAYRKALYTVAPFGPCRYGPLLKQVIEMTRETNTKHGAISYTVLLLLTDGDFADFADVANLICDGAELPLSLVIVGVGNSRFLQLERLDGDDDRLCSTEGIPCARDIVQFVQFHKHRHNPTQLAQEVLDEIPEQLVSYMRSKGLKPSDITPLREVPPQVPAATEKHPYLPESVLQSIPSNNSAVPTPELTRISDPSLAHRPGLVSVPPNNRVNVATPYSSPRPVVSGPTLEVPAPGTSFHQPSIAPQVLQPVITSEAESGPPRPQLSRPPQPSLDSQRPSTSSHGPSQSHASANMAGAPCPGATFHQTPMLSQHSAQVLHSAPSPGAESVPPTSHFNGPVQPSHDAQLSNMPPQGSGHTSHPQHLLKTQSNPHDSPTYGLMQGHPPQYSGGYGTHVHLQNEPHHIQQNGHQHHLQHQQASPYHHLHGPHSQQHTLPHHYGSYPYAHQPAQYAGTYNQAPYSDLAPAYSPYPVSSGQPYPYPPGLGSVPPQEMYYHSQHNAPNYPSR